MTYMISPGFSSFRYEMETVMQPTLLVCFENPRCHLCTVLAKLFSVGWFGLVWFWPTIPWSIMMLRTWCQRARLHYIQEERDECWFVHFLPFSLSPFPSPEMCHPHRGPSSSSVLPLWKHPHRHAQKFFSSMTPNPVQGTMEMTHPTYLPCQVTF